MMMLSNKHRPLAKLFLLLCLSLQAYGCKSDGGGDAGGSSNLPTPPSRTPPTISIIGQEHTEVLVNAVYSDPGATASDTVDGNLTGSITTENKVNSSTPGLYSVTYKVMNSASQTTTAVRSVTVSDPFDQDDISDEAVLSEYFDIQTGSIAGSKVTGRINLLRNKEALGSWNTTPISVPASYRFYLIGDSSNGMFSLNTIRDASGYRLFGEFSVADGRTALAGEYPVRVELRDGNEVKARFTSNIHVVDKTQWASYFEKLTQFAQSESRLWGRNKLIYGSPELESILSQIEAHNGQFTDLHIYNMNSTDELLDYKASKNIKAFETAANRIGGIGHALKVLDTSDSHYNDKRSRLINAILTSFNAYAALIPVHEFDDFSHDASPNGISFTDRTHQWRFTDPVTLPLILAFNTLWEEAQDGSDDAEQFLYNIHNLFQIAFALPYQHRFDQEYDPATTLYTKYYLEKDLSQSPGAWSDANRHHRIRSWSAMAGLWKDYNRPLTDKSWWYDGYQPFADHNTTLLNSWTPEGSLKDLKAWIDSNATRGLTIGNAGLLPDGTISHHTGLRQDMAMYAYGYEWLATTPMKVAELLRDTQWSIDGQSIDNSAEFILKSVKPVIYKDGHDYQTTGRSFLSDSLGSFGSAKVAKDISIILSGKPENAAVSFEQDLLDFQTSLISGNHELSGSYPFWNSEFLVHRRGGIDNEDPWYASFSAQSIRVRGAESFDSDPGFHNGSGILQVKITGDEYGEARFDWDWHLQPGLTEEWRNDAIPMQSQDDKNGLSDEVLAGVLSDGRNSIGSFKYSTKASYASARADKSAFFSDAGVFAMGDQIRRDDKDGQYASNAQNPIVTTVDQALWSSALSYDFGSGIKSHNVGSNLNFSVVITEPVWVHQNNKGYLIWPDSDGSTKLTIVAGSAVNDTYTKVNRNIPVYSLLIDHGITPDNNSDSYQYLVLPNVSQAEMPGLLAQFSNQNQFERIQTDSIYGTRWVLNGEQLIQLAFHQQGMATLEDGKTITVDKPALVQLQETGDLWIVSISDLSHHSRDDDPDQKSDFRVQLKEGENIVNVELNWSLQPGSYQYLTKGYRNHYLPGQDMSVRTFGNTSRISVSLPDSTDDQTYGFREELFSGMTATASIPAN
ncbi:polysaccharide lyase family 8 super-sandwich domain-containing protein [Endozoicomonas elysicola]|uniref:Pesticidal crystal protein Cry22Aa Ig-like domain-containing protein n=1 Tax=Endozoicomonas elysicola TaxID=305900 RepID=A0A081K594_9GAMM|nr:polysaccharide lyase family 8 super-sandwich domain-containing protein [Endozoicomonas elysicola]KEI69320.1 hypothetical protein GV64_24550 [Endozoicomonas elysicola]